MSSYRHYRAFGNFRYYAITLGETSKMPPFQDMRITLFRVGIAIVTTRIYHDCNKNIIRLNTNINIILIRL